LESNETPSQVWKKNPKNPTNRTKERGSWVFSGKKKNNKGAKAFEETKGQGGGQRQEKPMGKKKTGVGVICSGVKGRGKKKKVVPEKEREGALSNPPNGRNKGGKNP